jgi:hypothetical protein
MLSCAENSQERAMEGKNGASASLKEQRHKAAERYRRAGFPAYAELVEQGHADACSQMKAVQSKS